jgi:alanyl-tRNA synthetase
LRRIIRRALRHGQKLGQNQAFFYKGVQTLVEEMGDFYTQLKTEQSYIENTIKTEEEQFLKTLEQGLKILENAILDIKNKTIAGDIAFKLYDTYGFPLDLTQDFARENGLAVDIVGFDLEMDKQKAQARAAGKFKSNETLDLHFTTAFKGYDNSVYNGTIEEIIDNNIIVLNETPFYAEMGGQVGDTGFLESANGIFEVINTQKQGATFLHYGHFVRGQFNKGENVTAKINLANRYKIEANHSATHLLHAALKQVLGDNVHQKGSQVSSDKLRFDFNYQGVIDKKQLLKIEQIVNQKILEKIPVIIKEMPIDDARKLGAQALFGEKYGDIVRVVTIDEHFSIELCGGTHVGNSGEIGIFKITSETGVSAGVRRIEAITGFAVYQFLQELENKQNQISILLKSPEIVAKTEALVNENKEQKNLIKKLQQMQSQIAVQNLLSSVKNGKLVAQVDGNASDILDALKSHFTDFAFVLLTVDNGKMNMVVNVSKSLTDKYSANTILKELLALSNGKGGGKNEIAKGVSENVTVDIIHQTLDKGWQLVS